MIISLLQERKRHIIDAVCAMLVVAETTHAISATSLFDALRKCNTAEDILALELSAVYLYRIGYNPGFWQELFEGLAMQRKIFQQNEWQQLLDESLKLANKNNARYI